MADGFAKIRNGLLDHALTGKLAPFDFGLYVFLIMRADFATGIYQGCALTIAYQFAASPEREGQRVTADYVQYLGRTPTAATNPASPDCEAHPRQRRLTSS